MSMDDLLGRLRKTVKKIRFLLNFNVQKWRLMAAMIGGGGSLTKRRISFKEPPGLRSFSEYFSDLEGSVSPAGELQRTISYTSDEDVDKRADLFIANFYRQLQIERQISLDLHYCNGNSFKWTSPS